MEIYNIYCGFWEGMKEISVGVCLNDYTWLEIWEKKEKWIVQKDQVKKSKKKMVLKSKKKKNEERKEVEVQFELYCVKLVELVLFEKKNCAPLVFRNYIVPDIYLFFIVNPLTLVASLQPC